MHSGQLATRTSAGTRKMVGSARWSDCKCVSASDLSCSLLVIFTAVGVANDDDVMIPSTVVIVIGGDGGAGAGAGGSLFCCKGKGTT